MINLISGLKFLFLSKPIKPSNQMKRKLNVWVIFLCIASVNFIIAQDFQVTAVYEYRENIKGKISIDMPNTNDVFTQNILDKIQKGYEKTFLMHLNKFESVYQESQKNSLINNDYTYEESKLYHDLNKNLFIEQIENDFNGKKYLVSENGTNINWVLENESKMIGTYTCYKATYTKKVTTEELKLYNDEVEKNKNNKTNLLIINEPKDKTITVWYTPEIPVSHGPDRYFGLPGLILEVIDDTVAILCSKVVINPKRKIKISKPVKGKLIPKADYDKLVESQYEKMKDADGVIHLNVQGD